MSAPAGEMPLTIMRNRAGSVELSSARKDRCDLLYDRRERKSEGIFGSHNRSAMVVP